MDEVDFLGGEIVDLGLDAERTGRSLGVMSQEVAKNGAEVERSSTKYAVSTGRVSRQLSRAFSDVVIDGEKLSGVLNTLANAISETTYRAAIRPVTDHVAGGITGVINGLLGFAQGGAFTQSKVTPFARGGVVAGPVSFPMRGATGLMGEAGPEAIMPLSRGPDGKLGVRAAGGGGPVNVVMNISTPDVQGFQRSQSQLAAQMGRALSRGQRNR
jgi:hypothetical protein